MNCVRVHTPMHTDNDETHKELTQLRYRLANAMASNAELSALVARLVDRNREYETELDQYRMQTMEVAA